MFTEVIISILSSIVTCVFFIIAAGYFGRATLKSCNTLFGGCQPERISNQSCTDEVSLPKDFILEVISFIDHLYDILRSMDCQLQDIKDKNPQNQTTIQHPTSHKPHLSLVKPLQISINNQPPSCHHIHPTNNKTMPLPKSVIRQKQKQGYVWVKKSSINSKEHQCKSANMANSVIPQPERHPKYNNKKSKYSYYSQHPVVSHISLPYIDSQVNSKFKRVFKAIVNYQIAIEPKNQSQIVKKSRKRKKRNPPVINLPVIQSVNLV